MKKEIVLFYFIFMISLVSAVPELDFQKQNYSVGETLLGTIKGDFVEKISEENFQFYEGRKNVFIEHDFILYNGTYYFYAYLNREGNFSLKIKDILYGSPMKEVDLSRNFSVSKSNYSVSIKPGFIYMEDESEIVIKNYGQEVNLSYVFYNSSEFELKEGGEKIIEVIPLEEFEYFNISGYNQFSIPVIYKKLEKNNTGFGDIEKDILRIDPPKISIISLVGEEKDINVSLVNFGEEDIKNISISGDLDFLEYSEIENISAKSLKNISLIFSAEEGSYSGLLNFSYVVLNKSYNKNLEIEFFVFPANSSNSSNFEAESETCSELEGELCLDNEKCDGSPVYSSDGYCCIGSCFEMEEEKDYGWIWGVLIFLILGIVAFLVFIKFKRTKQTSYKEKLNNSSKNFEKKFKS